MCTLLHQAVWGMLRGGCLAIIRGKCASLCASTITSRRGWSLMGCTGGATSALALDQLDLSVTQQHSQFPSWSCITHRNTGLKTTFSWVTVLEVSMVQVMVNLQRFELGWGELNMYCMVRCLCNLKQHWELLEIKSWSTTFPTHLVPAMEGEMKAQIMSRLKIQGQT